MPPGLNLTSRLGLTGLCLLAGCSSGVEPPPTPAPQPPIPAPAKSGAPTLTSTPFIVPAVRNPELFPADEVSLPDSAPVIGIVAGEAARAYLCEAMASMMTHVVSDMVGETRMSITYCDRTDCVRVLRTADGQAPDVMTGGFDKGQMLLKVGPRMYPQVSKELPLVDEPFVRTTWGEWKSQHPQTTVFLGQLKSKWRKPPQPRQPEPADEPALPRDHDGRVPQ